MEGTQAYNWICSRSQGVGRATREAYEEGEAYTLSCAGGIAEGMRSSYSSRDDHGRPECYQLHQLEQKWDTGRGYMLEDNIFDDAMRLGVKDWECRPTKGKKSSRTAESRLQASPRVNDSLTWNRARIRGSRRPTYWKITIRTPFQCSVL